MKKTYSIEGMSCNGCRGHVEKSLLNVTGVADVSVDLEDAEATVESQYEVPLENLQEALQNSQYSIKPQKVG
ncbi:heavy metal-associated domain-containing protein [Maribacter sp. PR1]|uniref:Heavy metal-associated domain-containing protein n=1 Tax=Maribacter cobaltidurans TaxID=1178778 RepID=A0ABU7ITZ7_9FLAO|nr:MULTISPECIES: heavy metal-associated domain-containing protein [Maribacter]MDC6388868.1 heavy metal-associated domain-containing protein [Maribacter sp. PR1]MEE1976256.1 heavy metal-associated domain-containing protein [Maribacter cobaltidurans]